MRDRSVQSPYMYFSRAEWAALRNAVPMTLNPAEVRTLKGINEDLSIAEVTEIYLPLARLLEFYINSNQYRTAALDRFLGNNNRRPPYVIGIAGSVAVGKSTTARVLQALLSRWPEHRKVELVTTDGFLLPNAELEARGLMQKKGFPVSFDIQNLVRFVSELKAGAPKLEAPIYSHFTYDVLPDQGKTVEQPDILILEGLNVLQSGMDYPHDPHHVFVSDFVDFSIYVDAAIEHINSWFIRRFMKLRESVFSDPSSYFHKYANLSDREAIATANQIWHDINERNLIENILPTRERGNLILTKGAEHAVEQVKLRK